MKVLICVPAYGGVVRVETMQSITGGMMHLMRHNPSIDIRLFCIDLAEIPRVRNIFASVALKDGYDAMIMVDADMGVPHDVFDKLLNSGYDVCGLTYPKRSLDLERFHAAAAAGKSVEQATVDGLTFIVASDFVRTDGQLKVNEGFVEMNALPGGCLLIRGHVLTQMAESLPGILQTQRMGDAEARAGLDRVLLCFDNIVQNGTKYSEDISFCIRWRTLGGKIHALAAAKVAHYGGMKFEGAYLDWLKGLAKPGAAPTLPGTASSPVARNPKSTGRAAR